MPRRILGLAAIVLIALAVGCSHDNVCRIRSDTSWTGVFEDRTVSASGDANIELPDDEDVCCVARKTTFDGYLAVQVVTETNGLGSIFDHSNDGEPAYTTAPFGVAASCSD